MSEEREVDRSAHQPGVTKIVVCCQEKYIKCKRGSGIHFFGILKHVC
jgi:hypothetical protein